MIHTVAKLRAPLFGGKATVAFGKKFRRMRPADRMSLLSQCMKQMRVEYDLAESHCRIEAQHEDARNAEAATVRNAEPINVGPSTKQLGLPPDCATHIA